jgi:hypothetical protein
MMTQQNDELKPRIHCSPNLCKALRVLLQHVFSVVVTPGSVNNLRYEIHIVSH